MDQNPERRPAPATTLIIISGAGRSGTSTLAGVLKQLGFYVPQPEIEADRTNPRGFFESAWAVEFHKRLLRQVGVRTLDARPEAAAHALDAVVDPKNRQQLHRWLSSQVPAPRVLVKDPRAFWFKDLWFMVARSLDVAPAVVTMLRHPTEVVASRAAYYLSDLPTDERLARQTSNLAGWINVALVNEQQTRGDRRAFVSYRRLLDDWRDALATAAVQLDVSIDIHRPPRQREVDDFVDMSLRRVTAGWNDIDVSPGLRDVAEGTWQALTVLVDEPHDRKALVRLDELRAAYDDMHARAVALAHHHTQTQMLVARKELRRRLERERGR
jgi:hypothetical protein